MSQERKEPNSTWQYSHLNVDRWEDELEDLPPLSYPQDDEEAALSGPSPFPSEDFADDDASPVTAFFAHFEGLLQLGQQLSPILIPLLFGGLTFLFILPLARTDHAYLRCTQVWPVV